MAARKMTILHQEDVRKKIQAGQLIKTLQDHALGNLAELPPSRIKAIEILLRKSIADLSAIELTGANGDAVKFEVVAPWLQSSIQKRNSA